MTAHLQVVLGRPSAREAGPGSKRCISDPQFVPGQATQYKRFAEVLGDGSDGTRTRDLRRDRPAFARRTSSPPDRPQAASALQASRFRGDVTVFRLNAPAAAESGLETAFRRNTAERVYIIEEAHKPEVAGSNPAPATVKGAGNGAFRVWRAKAAREAFAQLLPGRLGSAKHRAEMDALANAVKDGVQRWSSSRSP
jgi:hypothetical protein